MLKREITYEDFNGERKTESFYFNLTQTEIIEYQVEYEGGLDSVIRNIIAASDIKSLVAEFKKIVLLAYGIRSEDGKRFIKSPELREEFTQTAAFDALFMELATNADAASTFIKGVVPRDFAKEMDTIDIPLPPPPPAAA